MKLLMHRINRTDKNVHLQRNIEMFRRLGIEVRDVYNDDLLRGDLSGADAICLNWFENIDGGRAFMPPLRYARRLLQLHRIKKAGLSLLFYMHNRFPAQPALSEAEPGSVPPACKAGRRDPHLCRGDRRGT